MKRGESVLLGEGRLSSSRIDNLHCWMVIGLAFVKRNHCKGCVSFWLAIVSRREGEVVFGSGTAAAKHHTSLLSVC